MQPGHPWRWRQVALHRWYWGQSCTEEPKPGLGQAADGRDAEPVEAVPVEAVRFAGEQDNRAVGLDYASRKTSALPAAAAATQVEAASAEPQPYSDSS